MIHHTLGSLAAILATLPPDSRIAEGWSSPHCDRGNYTCCAFEWEGPRTVAELREAVQTALQGGPFHGWNGGDYIFDADTPVYLGEYGFCGDPLTDALLRRLLAAPSSAELE